MIDRVLAVFSFGALQEAVVIHDTLEVNGLNMTDLKNHIQSVVAEAKTRHRQMRRDIEIADQTARLLPDCPDCGGKLRLSPGDDNDSHLWCPECRFGQYVNKPVADVLKALSKEA